MRATRWFVTALIMALVVGLWASPSATAAKRWSPLQMSWTGKTWSAKLNRPIFSDTTLIPGQSLTRSFYVRNRSQDKANLVLRVTLDDKSKLVPDKNFRLEVGYRNFYRRILASGDKGLAIKIPQGGTDEVQVRLKLYKKAPNATQFRTFNFKLELRLTQA